jgi:hypothetical protein
MANVMSTPTNFPRRINSYVPAMSYSSDVAFNGVTRVNFGAPIASSSVNVVNNASINAGATIDISSVFSYMPYGRNLQVVASIAATSIVDVYGYDYLGQPMVERFTLNGVTPVNGNKAFYSGNVVIAAATAGASISIGSGNKLGLPYKTLRCEWETANGLIVAAGTVQAPALGAQSLTSLDPRGLYTPTTTPNAVNIITAAFDMVNDVDSANNGGLHGIRHFAG